MTNLSPICRIEPLSSFYDFRATVDVLRLDLLHPVVSGNKWFKLKHYIADANKKTILTFGGAYSNHIVATAAAAHQHGLQSVGVIRGEEPIVYSPTLTQAKGYGMNLFFSSREAYKSKIIPPNVYRQYSAEELYVIPEGGYGFKGMQGAKDILLLNDTQKYTHLISAVGTGTTLAGLTAAADVHQQVIGVPVLKNNFSISDEINDLLQAEKRHRFQLMHDYHFGGYARYNQELIQFMNDFFEKTSIPTDFVYTAKAFYAVYDLLKNGAISDTDKILLVHTGGLQGNCSLPNGTLIFG